MSQPNYKKFYMVGTKWRGRLHIDSIRILDAVEAGRFLAAVNPNETWNQWAVWEVSNIGPPQLLKPHQVQALIDAVN